MTIDDPRPGRPECDACPRRSGVYVPPQIRPDARVLILGEAPGERESEAGVSFVGPSGRLLDGLLAKAGLDRECVSVVNATACYLPGYPTPEADALEACSGLVERALTEARPKVIVAVGGVATTRMVGDRRIGRWQGSVVTTPGTVDLGTKTVVGMVVNGKCGTCRGKGTTSTGRGKTKTTTPCSTCTGTGTVRGPESFVSGARKGQLKPRRVNVTIQQPEGRTVVLTFHPAALLDSGLSEYPLVVAALRRARMLAEDRPLIEVGESIIAYPQDASVAGILLEATKEITLDVEADRTTGKLSVIGLSPSPDYGVVFLPTPELHEILRRAMAEPDRTFIGQNLAYDTHQLETYRQWRLKKLVFGGWGFQHEVHPSARIRVACKLWDTHHASAYEQGDLAEIIKPHALEQIASRTRMYRYDNWKERYRSGEAPSIFAYNALDCCWTSAVAEEWKAKLERTGRLRHFERNMMPALRTLIDVEADGVQIDRVVLEALHTQQQEVVDRLQREWDQETGGVNEASTGAKGELRGYFYGKLGLPKQFKGRGRKRVETLDESACEALYKKFPKITALRILVHLRHAKKVLVTWLEPQLDERGRLHPECDLTGAVTGRHSGSFQQFPLTDDKCVSQVEGCVCGRVRETVVADSGDYAYAICDKKQVEFRIAGPLSGDPKILGIYDQPDGDIHNWSAARLGVPRKIAKHMTHAACFGAGAAKVAAFTGTDVGLAQRFIDTIRSEFPTYFQWQAHQVAEARRLGYITTRFGRRVPFRVQDGKIKETEVAAALVQSPAADMLNVDAWRVREAGLKTRHLLHDEVGISARDTADVKLLKEIVELSYEELGWACPSDVGTGQSWAAAKGKL